MTDTPHTVNAYGVDPNTIDAAHADRVAHALGLSHAVRIGCGGFLHGISRGVLTITPNPFDLRNPRIVSVPWALVAGLGAQAVGAQVGVPEGWLATGRDAAAGWTIDPAMLLAVHKDMGDNVPCDADIPHMEQTEAVLLAMVRMGLAAAPTPEGEHQQ